MEELYRSLYAKYATGLSPEDIEKKIQYALEQDPAGFINSFYEKYTGAGPSAEQANYIASKIETDLKDRYDKSEELMPEDVSMFENTGKWLKGVAQNWFGGWSDATDNMLGEDVTEDDIMGEDFSKTIEKNTLFEDAIGKNPFSDFMSDVFYRKLLSGWDSGGGIDEDSLLHGYDHINDVPEEVMKQYVEHLTRKDIPPPTDEDLAYQQRYDQLKEKNGGIQAWFTAVMENPTWLLQTTSQSMAMMARAAFTKEGLKGISGYGLIDPDNETAWKHGGVPGGWVMGKGIDKLADKIPTNVKGKYGTFLRFLRSGLKGSAKFMPIGGAMGGVSYSLEKNLTLSETIKEKLAEKELDITPENITKILSDPEDYRKIKNDAVKRGVAIGLVDTITGGFAGGFGRALGLGVSKSAGLATAAVTDITGGLTSEILGQYAGDQEWRVDEILAEGFAERSKTIALAPYILTQPSGTYSINGEKYTGYRFRRALEDLDDETIALADIQVDNDNVLENHVANRRRDGRIKNSILSTKVTDQNDRQTLFELEKQKLELESKQKTNPSQTLTNQITEVNKKIKNITDQYFEVDPTLKQRQQEQAKVFTGEKDFEKSVAKGKIIMGEDLQVADTQDEFNNIEDLKNNYSLEELNQSAGINHNGKIYINKALALGPGGNINVVAHEILHSALDKHVKTDQGKAAVMKFYNNLDKATKQEVDRQLEKRGYTQDYINKNPDEILAQYLDLVEDKKSNIDINENTLTKLNDFLAEFLQSVGLKGKFKTAGDVRRFLTEYRKKFKSGELKVDDKVTGKKKSTTVNLEGRKDIPLDQKVDELVKDVKTKEDFLKPSVFNNIYNGIMQGRFDQLFGEGISQEKKEKMRYELGLRLMNYDPVKSPSLYAWMVGNPQKKKPGNIDYSDRVAKKKLAKESEKAKREESTIDKEGKTIDIADTTNPFDIDSELKKVDKTYTTLLEAGIFDGKIIKAIKEKLITEVRIIKKSIYDAISKNKKVSPFVSSLRESIKKQADIIIRKWLGGLENNEFKNNLIKHKKVILENLTTSFLARFAPQTIEKSVGGQKIFDENGKIIGFKPKWVDHTVWNKKGVKVDKEIAALTGRTSQHQLMRRKPDVEKSITDKEWVDIFFDKNNKIKAMKKESLSQQLAAELALDIFKDDLINNGPISESFNLNNETKEIALEDNYVAEVGRQLERGNVKFSKIFKAPIPEGVDGRTYTKNMNEINAIVRTGETIEDFVIDNEWTDPRLQKYPTWYIEHFREIEDKGVFASTGFVGMLNRLGMPKSIVNLFKNDPKPTNKMLGYKSRKKLHSDNKKIAASPIGRIIKTIYTGRRGSLLDISMLGYIKRVLNPAKETGEFAKEHQDIKTILLENKKRLPKRVERALEHVTIWNGQKGRMFEIMVEIYKEEGVRNQLKKLKEFLPEIRKANEANTIVLKYLIQELRKLVLNGDISVNSALHILQLQTNTALGIKGLTTWKYLTIDGKKRTREELKAPGTRLYGEHLMVNVAAMGQIANMLTNKKRINVSNEVDNVLEEYTQLATFADKAKKIDQVGRTNFTMAVDRINQLDKSDLNDIYDIDGVKFRESRTNDIINKRANQLKDLSKAEIQDKATEQISKFSKVEKGITVLDFDDTLATSDSKVIVKLNGKVTKITPAQFAEKHGELERLGAEFDFSEFNKVIKGKKGPLFDLALKRQKKFGSKDIFILTARPQTSAVSIQKFLKELGLNIPLKNIIGLEDGRPQAKADWIVSKLAEGYNNFYFADDHTGNVQAVKRVLKQADVKSDVQQARKFSKTLDENFNTILERESGINKEESFSDAEARARGAKKNPFRFFIPPSAEDFMGLMYWFLPEGKAGDISMRFIKQALIDPYWKGIRALNAAKQALSNDFQELKRRFPKAFKALNKNTGIKDFTNEDAIRVYLWDKAGFDIPGLSNTDRQALVNYVNSNLNMKNFADLVGRTTKLEEGYIKPKNEDWISGSIAYDFFEIAQKINRKKFLAGWIEIKNEVFSKKNMNKIEAIYGTDFREALEDILWRMEHGTNRTTGKNKLVNAWLNWVNNSVGAIMFFNSRSAVLQTISMINFINWSDNNILKAALAFANQKQFWADFSMIFNSDMLKQRRAGLQTNVHEAEIAQAVAGKTDKFSAIVSFLLRKGFLPTQIADSFAISMGGASFYRNRFNTYKKQGMSDQAAHEKAFADFQQTSEVSQQSADPALISAQQASPLGRLILAFQNTPMQYARLIKKAVVDLKNGRGDVKTNISKILYYGAVQNIIFSSLQSALFAVAFSKDEEDEELFKSKKMRAFNTSLDSLLRGMGVYGAGVSTIKNMILQFNKQEKKEWNADHAYTLIEAVNLSPPIGSKLRKLYSALQTYKFNRDVIPEMGMDIDNPAILAVANVVSATTNIPLDRVVMKLNNLRAASDKENAMWQRIATFLGWNTWDVGVENKAVEEAKAKLKKSKKRRKKTYKKPKYKK